MGSSHLSARRRANGPRHSIFLTTLLLVAACKGDFEVEIPDLHIDLDFEGVAQTVPPADSTNVPALGSFIMFADAVYTNVEFTITSTVDGETTDITESVVIATFDSGADKPIYVLSPLGGFEAGATIDVTVTGDIDREFSFTCSGAEPPTFGDDVSFENDPSGWLLLGDASFKGATGSIAPTDGDRALVLTTGALGGGKAIAETSSYAVSGLVDLTGATKLTFDYNLQSSEFEDYCASAFDDTLLVVVSGPTGSASAVVDSVNLVCARSAQKAGSFPGGPDGGDSVYMETGVTTFSLDLDVEAIGTPASISFITTDVGDGILSTVVGIDALRLE